MLRVLHDHHLPVSSLQGRFGATVMAKLPTALHMVGLAKDRAQLDAFLRCSKQYRYCADDVSMLNCSTQLIGPCLNDSLTTDYIYSSC